MIGLRTHPFDGLSITSKFPDFYFFEPRKKRGWSLSSFLLWGSSETKRYEEVRARQTEEELPLIKGLSGKKAE
jgi:hypothetical protein